MIKEIVCTLPKVLKNHICTLKKASMDTTNKAPMCESLIEVIDFDKIPNEFARGKGWGEFLNQMMHCMSIFRENGILLNLKMELFIKMKYSERYMIVFLCLSNGELFLILNLFEVM